MNVDLGRDYCPPSCSPCCGQDKAAEKHYPYVHLETEKELDLPEEGVISIRFKRTRKSEQCSKDKTYYEVTLDLMEIVNVKASEKKQDDEDSGEVLDKLLAEKE